MSSVEITRTILPSKLQSFSLVKGNKAKDCCPSHDDLIPSLTVRMTGQNILIHCFERCGFTEILSFLGSEKSDFSNKLNGFISQQREEARTHLRYSPLCHLYSKESIEEISVFLNRFFNDLEQDSVLINDDWYEKWDKTLGLRDESEILCPSCERFSAQGVCPSCGAYIKTNH